MWVQDLDKFGAGCARFHCGSMVIGSVDEDPRMAKKMMKTRCCLRLPHCRGRDKETEQQGLGSSIDLNFQYWLRGFVSSGVRVVGCKVQRQGFRV